VGSKQLYEHLEKFRLLLSWSSSAAIILAEANVPAASSGARS
jgi:hypothetical protein